MRNAILLICAIISTLCLLYFVVSNEVTGCLVYPDSYVCKKLMEMLPDDPETTILKRLKREKQ